MIFFCNNCKKEIKVSDKKAEGYYNWKCPYCLRIANKKDSGYGTYIFKCDTGTIKRNKK